MNLQFILLGLKNSFHRYTSQLRKELDWVIHDKLSFIIMFGLPLVILSLIGGGAFTVTNITGTPSVYMLDLDQTEYSLAFINNYRNSSLFPMDIKDNYHEPDIVTLENCEIMILTDDLDAYIIIPENFTENLLVNRSSEISIIIDYDSELGGLVLTYFNNGNILYQSEYQIFNSELIYIPNFRPDENFSFIKITLPILIPLLLFVCANLIASQSIVGDEPLKRLLITPARRIEVVLSKFTAYSILGIILAFLSLLILNVGFKVEFYSFLNTFIIVAMVPIFGVSYGVMFSSVVGSKLQAAQLSLFSFIIQFVFLIFIRVEPIVQMLPAEIIREMFTLVAFRGVSLGSVWYRFGEIFLHNLVILLLAIIFYKTKKQEI